MTISVITPTYNTHPDVLARTWASLKSQTYTDWEWVVYDDSLDDGVWRQLWGYCADERYRIVPLRGMSNNGNIGRVKRRAFMAAEGDILVELDHDDELTPDCLQEIDKAFYPNIDFVFSNWSEILPNGESGQYPEGWAFGYGSEYWDSEYGLWVMRSPEINRTTMSHIVSAPNHVRSWSAAFYRYIGGHDPKYTVADDYELMVRTILNGNWHHIDKLLYKQHISPSTAQRVRNGLIQKNVAEISARYSDLLDARFAPQEEG